MPCMANDNLNVLNEQIDVVDEKATKRVRKAKPKASEAGSTASLFGIEPYQPKKKDLLAFGDSATNAI